MLFSLFSSFIVRGDGLSLNQELVEQLGRILKSLSIDLKWFSNESDGYFGQRRFQMVNDTGVRKYAMPWYAWLKFVSNYKQNEPHKPASQTEPRAVCEIYFQSTVIILQRKI